MNNYKIIKILLCLILGISLISLFILIYKYTIQANNLNNVISEQYKYEEIQEVILEEKKDDDFILKYDKEKLKEINRDFIGWICIPDTAVNYPVVQGADNDFYLYRSFEKEYSVFGCILFDAKCARQIRPNNILPHFAPERKRKFSSCATFL